MTFLKGQSVELRVLEESDHEADTWTRAVNAGLTTQHLFTGSFPMRAIDIKAYWKKEREAGSVEFGIWTKSVYADVKQPVHPEIFFIGTCGLHSHRDIYRSWEARFLVFDPNAVGKGYGKEIVRLLTGYAFERLNAHRVWLGVNAHNLRALKCYLDCGYKVEGTLREDIFCFGEWHDAVRMGLLEDEWRNIDI